MPEMQEEARHRRSMRVMRPKGAVMRRIKLFFAILCVAAAAHAETRYYIGIDLGSSGTKAMLYCFKDGGPETIANKTINTTLVSSMNGARFTPAGIEDAASAAKQQIGRASCR